MYEYVNLKGVTGYVWVWTEYVVENFFRIHFLKICKFWVWAQVRRSKLLIWGWIRFFFEFIRRFFKFFKCRLFNNNYKKSANIFEKDPEPAFSLDELISQGPADEFGRKRKMHRHNEEPGLQQKWWRWTLRPRKLFRKSVLISRINQELPGFCICPDYWVFTQIQFDFIIEVL